jgi:membrane protein implicated in regulation of membrane protease activity
VRRAFRILEILICGLFLTLGLYLLNLGITGKSTGASAIVMTDAVFLALGLATLLFTVKSVLFHRAMVRHASGCDQASSPGRRTDDGKFSLRDKFPTRVAHRKT